MDLVTHHRQRVNSMPARPANHCPELVLSVGFLTAPRTGAVQKLARGPAALVNAKRLGVPQS